MVNSLEAKGRDSRTPLLLATAIFKRIATKGPSKRLLQTLWLLGFLLAALFLAGRVDAVVAPSPERTDPDLEALRSADLQLARIGYRLSLGAASLCDRQEPGLGVQFHTLAQYDPKVRARVRAHFGLAGSLGVEGVVADSPAALAGLRQDDTVVAVDRVAVPMDLPDQGSVAQLAALHDAIAALSPTGPVVITVMRDGIRKAFRVAPVAICRTRYELRIARDFDGRADGDIVQISSRYLEDTPAELLPAVVAHELAHNILRHRARLQAAGADFGFASGFGKNVGLFRRTEIEADILSVHLLVRAGYDPRIAGRFWRTVGPQLIKGMVRSRSHPPFADRAATVDAEAARFGVADRPPSLPQFYAQRNQPLDGNWRPLLVRAR